MKKPNEQQRRFVELYMGEANGNAAAAAEGAGFANPRQAGYRLLTYDYIKAAIAERVEADPLVATREELQQFWTSAMKGLEKGCDRLKASELLGKSQGVFIQRVELKTISHEEAIDQLDE